MSETVPLGVAGAVTRITLPFEIDLYQIRIDLLESCEDDLSPLLSAQELETAANLSRRQNRLESGITRACLKLLVADRLITDPKLVSVERDERRKPYVTTGDTRYSSFNVSHSYPWSLIAFASDGKIGVDVEAIRPLDDVENLARLTMVSEELDVLESKVPADRGPLFLRNWTRKEAVMKVLGIGIHVPLRKVRINPPVHRDTDPVQVTCGSEEYGTFYIIDASTDDYVASVAFTDRAVGE